MNNQALFLEASFALHQLSEVISKMTFDEYTQSLPVLSQSTIGQHTRHIIELFQQLNRGYESGKVDYDHRERNLTIETNIDYALECIARVISDIDRPDKELVLMTVYNDHELPVRTNYFRELMYNIEHCIHHQAIMKIGLLSLGEESLDDSFGVAKSTLIYRKQCVQ